MNFALAILYVFRFIVYCFIC